jgi:hypothetical protein
LLKSWLQVGSALAPSRERIEGGPRPRWLVTRHGCGNAGECR